MLYFRLGMFSSLLSPVEHWEQEDLEQLEAALELLDINAEAWEWAAVANSRSPIFKAM